MSLMFELALFGDCLFSVNLDVSSSLTLLHCDKTGDRFADLEASRRWGVNDDELMLSNFSSSCLW